MLKIYKLALGIEYNGYKYHGWQRQNGINSIQETLEQALSKIANESINIICAGRTDSGTSAIGQVVHFNTSALRNDVAWTVGVNANLPKDIVVNWVKNVPDNFHARFSAIARRYIYVIYNRYTRSAILNRFTMHNYILLDVNKMHNAAQYLVGENDFTSFRSVDCQSKTPWRNITYISVNRFGYYVIIDVKANAFLHHMVRNITGSLIQVGTGHKSEIWIKELLIAKNRTIISANKVKAEGLYLVSVDYPKYFNIPESNIKTIFLLL